MRLVYISGTVPRVSYFSSKKRCQSDLSSHKSLPKNSLKMLDELSGFWKQTNLSPCVFRLWIWHLFFMERNTFPSCQYRGVETIRKKTHCRNPRHFSRGGGGVGVIAWMDDSIFFVWYHELPFFSLGFTGQGCGNLIRHWTQGPRTDEVFAAPTGC